MYFINVAKLNKYTVIHNHISFLHGVVILVQGLWVDSWLQQEGDDFRHAHLTGHH